MSKVQDILDRVYQDITFGDNTCREIMLDLMLSSVADEDDIDGFDLILSVHEPKDPVTKEKVPGVIKSESVLGYTEDDFENPYDGEIPPEDMKEILAGLRKTESFARYAEDYKYLVFKTAIYKGQYGWLVPKKGYKGLVEEKPKELVCDLQNGYSAMKLTSRAQIKTEGRHLGHCVGRQDMGYLGICLSGDIELYSIRKDEDAVFTVEVKDGNVIQIKGKKNRLPGSLSDKRKAEEEVHAAHDFCTFLGVDPMAVADLQGGLTSHVHFAE